MPKIKNPWAQNPWFESVAEAQRRAKKRLPKSVYKALLAGSERGVTYHDNMDAFAELGFAPHVAGLSNTRDQATSIMGQDISLPVLISPTGVQAVHPEGEVAVARAAAARGTAMGLSSFASKPVEEVCAVNDKVFFQVYWQGGRESMSRRMDRARAAGAKGLILTLDWTFGFGRDWGSPAIPEKMTVGEIIKHLPEGVVRPAWGIQWLKSGAIPDLTTPNLTEPGQDAPTFFGAYGEWMQTPPPTWDDIAWVAKEWGGPTMLKGICRVDDAKRAVDAGMTAISVSNHGGNNLDTTPATIRMLPAVAKAVGNDVELLLDGGIRRGGDVLKAIALGAKAVMIGRAYLWGLGANGQAGVENVLDILRSGIDAALLGLGKESIHQLTADDIVIPADFQRSYGDRHEIATQHRGA